MKTILSQGIQALSPAGFGCCRVSPGTAGAAKAWLHLSPAGNDPTAPCAGLESSCTCRGAGLGARGHCSPGLGGIKWEWGQEWGHVQCPELTWGQEWGHGSDLRSPGTWGQEWGQEWGHGSVLNSPRQCWAQPGMVVTLSLQCPVLVPAVSHPCPCSVLPLSLQGEQGVLSNPSLQGPTSWKCWCRGKERRAGKPPQ